MRVSMSCDFGLHEIRSFVQNWFLVVSFLYVRRSANKVANYLAKVALSLDQQIVWLENCPSCIVNLVLAESSSNL
ncbi:hypothetical protein ACOSP7_018562 [Xanthoceras sorbifolium]